MPVRNRKDLAQSLKQGTIEPIYFLFGPESYLRDQAANAIAEEALRGTLLREFNYSVYSLKEGDARAAIAAAEQLPMMSPRRVVRIHDLGKVDEKSEEILLSYIDRPVETSVLIFAGDDLDKRKKLAKKLMSQAAFEFAPLNNAELAAWARSRVRELKSEIASPVLNRIIELVGADVRTLSHELDKLSTAALPSAKITAELVEE
ncbi:MAG TPA: DNA polymerase III subunit delta, partial [Pyrinomonadaceae bacterium]|nr:DNA polymerase III subunit delta [Pyrinomonadaceae bacterium]